MEATLYACTLLSSMLAGSILLGAHQEIYCPVCVQNDLLRELASTL